MWKSRRAVGPPMIITMNWESFQIISAPMGGFSRERCSSIQRFRFRAFSGSAMPPLPLAARGSAARPRARGAAAPRAPPRARPARDAPRRAEPYRRRDDDAQHRRPAPHPVTVSAIGEPGNPQMLEDVNREWRGGHELPGGGFSDAGPDQ